jgi:hypothetical protein
VDDERKLTATLAILYQLAKKFKYVKLEERVDYDLILVDALPQLLAIAEMCIENPSPDVLLILKLVVKVYHASSAYVLPSFIIEPEMFNSWMQLFAAIISIEVDEPDADDDPDELSQRPIWKLKKWTCRTLHILFQRYGTPSRCTREYKGFSDLYSETYSLPILELMWVQLQRYKVGSYMAPRVLTEILRYLENALEPAATWRHLKPLIPELLSDVLFPLLCFTEADLELWTDDAPEYIRRKLDLTVLAEINSPDIEAAVFVQDLIKIRQDAMTDLIFQFIHSVLQDCADPTTAPNPTAKDGALLMTSVIGNDLIGNRAYNHHLEEMLVTFVYPEFEVGIRFRFSFLSLFPSPTSRPVLFLCISHTSMLHRTLAKSHSTPIARAWVTFASLTVLAYAASHARALHCSLSVHTCPSSPSHTCPLLIIFAFPPWGLGGLVCFWYDLHPL